MGSTNLGGKCESLSGLKPLASVAALFYRSEVLYFDCDL